MTRTPSELAVSAGAVGAACLLAVDGVLDSGTYLKLRDSVIKAALDQPAAVLVDVTDLVVSAQSAWSVFTSARWHVSTWPDVPIMLVCPGLQMAATIARNGITRYVPVYPSVEAALRSVADHIPARRRASAHLPRSLHSLHRSRQLVGHWLTDWSQQELVPTAKVVVDVLVENALRHTDSAPTVGLESTDQTVTIAVQDASSAPAVRHESLPDGISRVSGLAVVAALSRSWGSMPTPNGKTVWAVIGSEGRL